MTPLQIILDIYTVAKVIYAAVETAKANQTQCATLYHRINIVTQSIKNLEKSENLEQYRAGLEALQACVKECASFAVTFSKGNSWFKNILKGGSHKEKFAALNQKLQESVQLLGLGLGAQQIVNREQDIKDEAKDRQAIIQQQDKIVELNIEANQKIEKMRLEQADQNAIMLHRLNSMKIQFARLAANAPIKPLIEAHLETAYYELTFERKINEGSFGKVYLGKWSGQEVAIKTLEGEISEEDREQFIREVQITSRLHCPHIVQLYAVCLEKERPCLVMEYMNQDSLYKLVAQGLLTPVQQKQIALDIAKGLLYLHGHGIIHRDLKSANILLSGYRAKIADFGLSKVGSRSIRSIHEKSTAIEWLAPECLQGNDTMALESDIYSYGMILWEITTGQRPYAQFKGVHRERELLKHLQSGKQETIPSTVPAFYTDLIKSCWYKNPKQRITLKSLIEKLEVYEPEKEINPADVYDKGCQYEAAGHIEQAAAEYQKSAAMGYPKAHTNLGFFYLQGNPSIKQDKSKAYAHFEKAAQAGHVRGMMNLARMHEKGDGVKQNKIQALFWYEQAAQKGDTSAQTKSQKLKSEASAPVGGSLKLGQ